jgi:hypothetical protein
LKEDTHYRQEHKTIVQHFSFEEVSKLSFAGGHAFLPSGQRKLKTCLIFIPKIINRFAGFVREVIRIPAVARPMQVELNLPDEVGIFII